MEDEINSNFFLLLSDVGKCVFTIYIYIDIAIDIIFVLREETPKIVEKFAAGEIIDREGNKYIIFV